jgi:hypothetical protein
VIKKLIAGLFLVSVLTVAVTLPAVADPTCYTGCSPIPGVPVPGIPVPGGFVGSGPTPTPGAQTSPSTPAPVPLASQSVPSGGLPFTGADVEQSAAIAVVALGAGFVLVRVGRRRRRAAH